jgi:DNA-binding MarR family transcriptional regulator
MTMPSEANHDPKRTPGRFAYEGLERIIHEKARLSVLSSLAAHPDGLLFNELKALCALTDGNLSRQITFLQTAGLVEVWKRFHNKRPQTLCRLTETGRARFLDYIAELERVVASAQKSAPAKSARKSHSGRPLPPRAAAPI